MAWVHRAHSDDLTFGELTSLMHLLKFEDKYLMRMGQQSIQRTREILGRGAVYTRRIRPVASSRLEVKLLPNLGQFTDGWDSPGAYSWPGAR
jgi:hypothetical protein